MDSGVETRPAAVLTHNFVFLGHCLPEVGVLFFFILFSFSIPFLCLFEKSLPPSPLTLCSFSTSTLLTFGARSFSGEGLSCALSDGEQHPRTHPPGARASSAPQCSSQPEHLQPLSSVLGVGDGAESPPTPQPRGRTTAVLRLLDS